MPLNLDLSDSFICSPNRLGNMLKNGKWPFFFLIILLSLFLIRCGGGSGGGSSGPPAGKITMAWDSEADPAVVGYRIYYGRVSRAVSGQYENSVDLGMATQTSSNTVSYTLGGLNIGQTYYIAITAYDGLHRESDFSNEVSGTAAP